jgi:SAM-dependent methyltransferase
MTNTDDHAEIHASVRDFYQAAADVAGDRADARADDDQRWGVARYDEASLDDVSDGAAGLSMGCGNPYAMADLQPGEVVLDLGAGGGIDVILSAKRVGPTGKAYGLDFLEDMVAKAQANAAEAGVDNVEFLHGMIEDVPLPDASVDVVISNCVINLAPDKRPVLAEIARVLRPGGRLAISDVVADDGYEVSVDDDAWAECGAGALAYSDYLTMLGEAGLVEVSIEFTHDTGPGLKAATVRGRRPTTEPGPTTI